MKGKEVNWQDFPTSNMFADYFTKLLKILCQVL